MCPAWTTTLRMRTSKVAVLKAAASGKLARAAEPGAMTMPRRATVTMFDPTMQTITMGDMYCPAMAPQKEEIGTIIYHSDRLIVTRHKRMGFSRTAAAKE